VSAAEGAACLAAPLAARARCGDYVAAAGTVAFGAREARAEILLQLIERPCNATRDAPAALTISLFAAGAVGEPAEPRAPGAPPPPARDGGDAASGSRSVTVLIHCA
jgi:hypothetical protein